jgi:hypothetical protein
VVRINRLLAILFSKRKIIESTAASPSRSLDPVSGPNEPAVTLESRTKGDMGGDVNLQLLFLASSISFYLLSNRAE